MEDNLGIMLIRLGDVDLIGSKQTFVALRKIKGVSYSFANAVCIIADISKHKKIGALTEAELKKIDDIIRNPSRYNIKPFLFNRQKDIETGENRHLISSELKLTAEFDIKRMKMIKSYKGIRHSLGQPVRGQRTKAHFRKGSALGVKKKPGVKKGKV
ncbi:30S ribosomal protein S13 [Candidatus Woesearchaeota archaeon]|nr:30S ribosomal protein S13 [Candidatus Woesearchaeota archaeon]